MARKALERLEAGLPAAWYYELAHYQRELDAFWYRQWIAAAREEELREPGDWRVVSVGTQNIVVLRDEKGALRAFHNTCRHRGSILCEKQSGRFERGRMVCPYHAWTYDLGGRLVGTPRRMETPDFDAAKFSLFEVSLDRWGGFVFINLAGTGGTAGLPEKYRNYNFQDL